MPSFPNQQDLAAGAIPVWIAPAPGQIQTNVDDNTGVLVKTGSGSIQSVTVNTAQAGAALAIYDGTSASGTLLGTISLAAQTQIPLNWTFTVGLYVKASGLTTGNATIASN